MSSSYFPYWMLLAAVVLFVLELFIPSGGVLGALSAVAVVVAIGSAFAYGGLTLGTIFMAATALSVPVLMFLMIKLWPRTPIGKRILIQQPPPQELISERVRQRQQLIGQRGVAISPLLPAGAIRVQGRNYDAISDGVSIDKGTAVEVIAIRNNAIVVRPSTQRADEPSGDEAPLRGDTFDAVVPDPFDDTLT